jgi:hypothetical protein
VGCSLLRVQEKEILRATRRAELRSIETISRAASSPAYENGITLRAA